MLESVTRPRSDLSGFGVSPVTGNRAGRLPPIRIGMAEIVTLFLYATLLIWAIPHHEPWADEAQAWQIARTLPLGQIFPLLSYEGHPGLWYLLLWLLSRLHVSYAGMHWIAAAIAFLGVALLVLASPFPRWLKLLLPFTFYLSFQYAVVARSYVMAPLLIFLCAYLWPGRLERPFAIAFCLGLLANVALHTAVISGGLAIVYAIDLWLGSRKDNSRVSARALVAASFLLLAMYGLSIWAAHPAKDASGAAFVFRPGNAPDSWINSQQSQLPPSYPPPEPENKRSLQWLNWKLEARLSGGLTDGLIRPFWLGCIFWILLAWKLLRTRKLRYLLPALFLVILCHTYAFFWHSGLMLPCVIGLLWMTWPVPETSFGRLPLYEQLPLLMLLLVAAVQIAWAAFAFQFDHAHDYGSGAATAAFLKPYVLEHAKIVEIGNDFLSVGIQPYYDHNLFLNQPQAYYWWSTRNPAKLRYEQLLPERPGIVVLEWRFHEFPSAETVAALPLAGQLSGLGYSNTQKFCGGLAGPGRAILEWDCDLIYQSR
jgi:hypothetical protein